jgi:hypothetical protein
MQTQGNWTTLERQLPVLLKGWPTAGKVTGQKEDLRQTLFRVTGTSDQKRSDGAIVRMYVLEVVKSPSK